MHSWGDKDVDWEGISDAAEWIGDRLARWGRITVSDTKEKFGTVRVYCTLGWYQASSVIWPRRRWFGTMPAWWWNFDCLYLSRCMWLVNWAAVPYQRWLYRRVYAAAVRRWPHLRLEILGGADFDEYLRGL